MKTLFLKNAIPFAVVAMGISGAFLTTSMQSAPKSATAIDGYTLNALNACNVRVDCSDISDNPVCRQGGDSGPQAFGKDNNNDCTELLYKP